MKFKITLSLLLFAFIFSANAQDTDGTKAEFVGTVTSMIHVPSIASQSNLKPADNTLKEAKDGRSSKAKVLIGKDKQTQDDYYARNQNKLAGKIPGRVPSIVFDAAQSNSQPTDPSIGVGPDHVFVVFNTGFIIYDKLGNALTSQIAPNPTIFPSGGCCDLTVSYDNEADRFVLSFLGNGAQIAVSDGPDPVNDGWFVYNIAQINDYQKLSVWSDGYYITENTGGTNRVWALERSKLLAGDPTASIQGFPLPGLVRDGFFSPQAFNVTDDNLPAPGNVPFVFLQDDAYAGISEDHIKMWLLNVDYDTPANSVMSAPQEFVTTPFISVFDGGSFSNLPQPGGGALIDALQATIMNQAQFRKYGDHNSAIFNFVVDTDGSNGKLAGIRWYEFRQSADGQPWSIYQEGTYIAPDGKHAWMGSMAMDVQGNIGMGYTSMAGPTTPDPTTKRVSAYYTGRFASDPLNTMTISEELIAAGNANIPGTRYGDYGKLDVDPSDDKTFWFTAEYMNSGRKDVVGAFQIAPNFNNDVGVVSIDSPETGPLSATTPVTVTIFNFGQNEASNFPVRFQVDGGTVITETFVGPLASATSASYTFTATADLNVQGQTYSITSSTNLTGDEDNGNDGVTKEVTHVFANDLGVTQIISPTDGEGLGNESITIEIENFGTADQTNFDVSYVLDGAPAVTETVSATVVGGSTINYTFTTQGDFSAVTTHTIEARTLLANDQDPSNDSTSKDVVNVSCQSNENTTSQPVGPDAGTVTTSIIEFTDDFVVNDANVTLNIDHTFVGDLDIKLVSPAGTEVVLSDRNGSSGDNYTDTTFDDEGTNEIGGGTAPFTGIFVPEEPLSNFNGEQSIGEWSLVITDNAGLDGGALLNWTLQLCGDIPLGITDNFVEDNDLLILTEGNDQFKIQLPTQQITERLTLTVTNMLGQQVLSYRLDNNGNGYEYDLNMSYASSGVYIVTLSNQSVKKSKRLIVK